MRSFVQISGFIVLITSGLPMLVACHRAQSREPHDTVALTAPAAASAPAEHDAAWAQTAAVVNVDPGNAVSQRRSESHFTPRTSKASVDSHTSSLAIQVAALNHQISVHKPLIEQQLRDLGLHVTAVKQSKMRNPTSFNSFNVLVEDVTYVEEVERKHDWEPVVYTMIPVIHVRVITANERNSFEAKPITVRTYGPLTSQAAADYGRQLATARVNLGKQLVEWLDSRVPRPENAAAAAAPNNAAAAASTKPALARRE